LGRPFLSDAVQNAAPEHQQKNNRPTPHPNNTTTTRTRLPLLGGHAEVRQARLHHVFAPPAHVCARAAGGVARGERGRERETERESRGRERDREGGRETEREERDREGRERQKEGERQREGERKQREGEEEKESAPRRRRRSSLSSPL